MPYRVDIADASANALDVLVELGALDVELVDGGIAAIMPDGVTHEQVAGALDGSALTVSAAVGRDSGSVWLLRPRAVRAGKFLITSPDMAAEPGPQIRLGDSAAFGSGHHPTTVLCIEALEEILTHERVDSVLDVGTGSGILALAALALGVPAAVGVDIDPEALRAAEANARLNDVAAKLKLVLGGPGAVDGQWPIVVANVLAAPLIDMAPVLIRRVRGHGRLILSGIPCSVESEVQRSYQNLGMRDFEVKRRAGWTMLTARTSW